MDKTTKETNFNSGFAMSQSHLWVAVHEKFKQQYIKQHGLPVKVSSSQETNFGRLMRSAITEYNIDQLN